MISQKITLTNPVGLHARPAAEFVKCASGFSSDIRVGRAGAKSVSAKSMVMVLSQGLTQGTEVEITADGADEAEALAALAGLLHGASPAE